MCLKNWCCNFISFVLTSLPHIKLFIVLLGGAKTQARKTGRHNEKHIVLLTGSSFNVPWPQYLATFSSLQRPHPLREFFTHSVLSKFKSEGYSDVSKWTKKHHIQLSPSKSELLPIPASPSTDHISVQLSYALLTPKLCEIREANCYFRNLRVER